MPVPNHNHNHRSDQQQQQQQQQQPLSRQARDGHGGAAMSRAPQPPLSPRTRRRRGIIDSLRQWAGRGRGQTGTELNI